MSRQIASLMPRRTRLSRPPKRIGEARAKDRERKKCKIKSDITQEPRTTSINETAHQLHVVTPSEEDPMYQSYLSLCRARPPNLTPGYKLISYDCYFRPTTMVPLARNKGLPQSLWKRIEKGEVGECEFHKMVWSNKSNRHTLFQNEQENIPIRVSFSYLEGTLMPFEEGKGKAGRFIGTVPLKNKRIEEMNNVNEDVELQGWQCFVKANGVRYFTKDEKKVYRLGDLLSFRLIVDAFRMSGRTGNFIYIWFYCIKHKLSSLAQGAANRKKLKNNHVLQKRKIVHSAETGSKEYLQLSVMKKECVDTTISISMALHECILTTSPSHTLRSSWKEMNLISQKNGCSELGIFREKQLKMCKEFNAIDDDNWETYLISLREIHFCIILLLSQETPDEILQKQYLSLSQGRLSLQQILHPLHNVTFFSTTKQLLRS